jgi:ketosteroid isomerase-like protein
MEENTLSQANERLIREYLEIATVTDDMDRFSQLIADDCVWVMMPTGHAFKGFEQVSSLAKMAGGTRTHNEKYKVKILNWFTDGEHFCVEYHHGAIIKGLHIKGTINICLVCHMREGKFDRIHEYVHAHGALFKLVMSLGLRILPLMVKRNYKSV